MPMTSYDWVVLSLVPLAWRNGTETERGLAFMLFLFAAVSLTGLRSLRIGIDLRYALISAEVLAFLALSCVAQWRTGGSASPVATGPNPSHAAV